MVKHFTLTLNGSAQQLSSVLAAGEVDVPCTSVDMQADGANLNPVFVGGPGVTTANYGNRIAVPVSSVPDPPYPLGGGVKGNLRLADIYVIGTNTQKLHINVVY